MKIHILKKLGLLFVAATVASTSFAQGEDCATATIITPGTYNGTTVGSVVDAVPFCGTADGTGGGVWYQISGVNNCGVFTASLCAGTSFDSKIRVYDGTCGTLNCIGGNDDFCSVQSEVAWNYVSGTTYFILVHGSGAAQGAFSLQVTETSTDVIDPVPSSASIPGAVDQSCTLNNTYMAGFYQTDIAQSFIPTQNTICGARTFTHADAGNGDLTITLYSNLPNSGGLVIASGVAVNAASGVWVDVVWPTVSVTPGVTYYLVFTCTNTAMGLDGNTTNPYPGGQVYANSGYSSFPSFDYLFETFYGCGVLSPVSSVCPIYSLTPPTAVDNCAGTIDGTSDAVFPIISNSTVTWTYDDGNGNTTTETQSVLIGGDVASPVADVVSLPDETFCLSATPVAPTATDNCDGTITATPDVTFPIVTGGTTVVNWTYQDVSGNTANQQQNIIVNTVNVGVAQTGPTLTADATGAAYQWLDCGNAYAVITGAITQSYSPSTVTGSYAVSVTENGCTDTSACFLMDFTGINERDNSISISVYPNPANNYFNVVFNGLNNEDVMLRIIDIQGKVVYTKTLNSLSGNFTEKIDATQLEQGVYLIEVIKNETILMTNRIVKI